jgi:hypothetical protein
MKAMQTEFEFTLPRGYVDAAGQAHQHGRMRLALALDEIESMQDPRVQANEAYLPIVLLARVVTQLGTLTAVTPHMIGGLFASDLAYLQDLYLRFNGMDQVAVNAVCPHCSAQFQLQVAPLN